MKHIGEIMEDIRDMPVCPKSGEINLYCIIQKHIEDGIFQSRRGLSEENTQECNSF